MFDPEGKRVTVMGLGRFGGGLSVTRYLVDRGADVLVTDLADGTALAEQLGVLQPLVDAGQVRLRLGGHNISDFTNTDAVVANPAVPKPWDNRFLRAAGAAGIEVITEIGLTVERLRGCRGVVGVTGTAGKSTVSAMTHHALNAMGSKARLGGNIGQGGGGAGEALLNSDVGADEFVVLELSSAMLYWLRETGVSLDPCAVCVTNFAPNHIDWHESLEHYEASKRWIVDGLTRPTPVILGEGVARWGAPTNSQTRVVEAVDAEGLPELAAPGSHNRLNGAMAAEVVAQLSLDLDDERISEALAGFAGLPHRLQRIGEIGGMTGFNDSKCTTPEGVLLAVDALRDSGYSRVHLIAGGYDKGLDLSPIADLVRAERVVSLTTIGATGATLAAAAGGSALYEETLDAAVERTRSVATAGDAVLLSPGCASWDQLEHYEARGEAFVAAFTRVFSGEEA